MPRSRNGGWRRRGADCAPRHRDDSAKGPVSRILFRTRRPSCGHSSRRSVAAYAHQRPTRRFRQLQRHSNDEDLSPGSPFEPPQRIGPMRSAAWLLAATSLPIWSCSVWGLPCPRPYGRSGALLPHLFTLTSARSCPPGEPFGPFRDALPISKEGRGSRGGIFSVALAVCEP